MFLKRNYLWGKWSAFEQLSWLLRHCHAQTTVFAAQGHVISLFCRNLLYLLPPELFPFSLWNLCSWHFLSFFDVLVASQSFTMSSSSCPKPTSSPITYSGGIFVTGPQVIFPFAKGLPVERAASFVHYFSFLFPQGLSFSVEFFKCASSGWHVFLFFRRSAFVLIQPIISSTISWFKGTPKPSLEVSIYSSSVLMCTRLQTY